MSNPLSNGILGIGGTGSILGSIVGDFGGNTTVSGSKSNSSTGIGGIFGTLLSTPLQLLGIGNSAATTGENTVTSLTDATSNGITTLTNSTSGLINSGSNLVNSGSSLVNSAGSLASGLVSTGTSALSSLTDFLPYILIGASIIAVVVILKK